MQEIVPSWYRRAHQTTQDGIRGREHVSRDDGGLVDTHMASVTFGGGVFYSSVSTKERPPLHNKDSCD